MPQPISLVSTIDRTLRALVLQGSEDVLRKIESMELQELAAVNPSIPELAKHAQEIIERIEDAIRADSTGTMKDQFKSLQQLQEYAEILDSIALAIADNNADLIVDCISHLREFCEINGEDR